MPLRDDGVLIKDMLDAATAALESVHGRKPVTMGEDHIWALGIVKCLEIIGEAAARISDEFKSTHTAVPWRAIIGMRNRLVHAYFEIDYGLIWKTLKRIYQYW